MYDLLLKGGRIYDGSGMPSYNGDVGIKNGKIVGDRPAKESATRTLNVDGLAVAPRLHRSAHPSRRAVILGSARHFVVFSWGDVGGARQLRFELGAGERKTATL